MDEHILKIEELFSAAKNVFKNLQYFIFIIALMNFCGKIILEDGKRDFRHMIL